MRYFAAGILGVQVTVLFLAQGGQAKTQYHHGRPLVSTNTPPVQPPPQENLMYTTPSSEDCKLLSIILPYVTMLEAVLEQYFKTDADAAVLFKLLGTLGRHVIVRNDAAEVRPALVKESVSFMREYEKFAHWLAENYNDRSLVPIAQIMDAIFAARFGKRLKIIEQEMKKLGQTESWNELMRFWRTVNGTDTEKLFAMTHGQLKSLDRFLDRTKSMALEHKSFELLYQTQVIEALADLARSMTTRKERNTESQAGAGPKYFKPLLIPVGGFVGSNKRSANYPSTDKPNEETQSLKSNAKFKGQLTTLRRKTRNENHTGSPSISLLHSTVFKDPQDTFSTVLVKKNTRKTSSDESSNEGDEEDVEEKTHRSPSTKKQAAPRKGNISKQENDAETEGLEEAERKGNNEKVSNKKKRGVDPKS